MRDDYKMQGPLAKIEIELEKSVLDRIAQMEKYTGLSKAELANTALKMFISRHHDFLPPREPKAPGK